VSDDLTPAHVAADRLALEGLEDAADALREALEVTE
jgi:hypothetical protein